MFHSVLRVTIALTKHWVVVGKQPVGSMPRRFHVGQWTNRPREWTIQSLNGQRVVNEWTTSGKKYGRQSVIQWSVTHPNKSTGNKNLFLCFFVFYRWVSCFDGCGSSVFWACWLLRPLDCIGHIWFCANIYGYPGYTSLYLL